MDFGPDKTDAQLLLDYGVLDADNPQVSFPSIATDRPCIVFGVADSYGSLLKLFSSGHLKARVDQIKLDSS